MGHVATIAASGGFLVTLADVLQERYRSTPERLADVVVYLPTHRACRELKQCWVQRALQPGFLPTFAALGEAEQQEDDPFSTLLFPSLPVVSPFRRRLLLARLIQETAETVEEKAQPGFDMALRLADAFASLQDEIQREMLDWSRLPYVVEETFSEHWQHVLRWLKVITHSWPSQLQKMDMMEPLEHRNLRVQQQVEHWKQSPPAAPVIIAGSTGSQPATRLLMRAVLAMPEGEVILPGLDQELPESEWSQLTAVHPQWGMKRLLHHLSVPRMQVKAMGVSVLPTPREQWIREIMRPVEGELSLLEGAPYAVHRLEVETQQQEARLVAALAREALHVPGKRIAIVTRHRELARRIAAELKVHHIACDDSAGRPLSHTPAGSWMRLLAEAAVGKTSHGLLSLLKHPLAAVGEDAVECRHHARLLERLYLRGHRRTPEELRHVMASAATLPLPTRRWFLQLDAMLSSWRALLTSERLVSLSLVISQHKAVAESLAATPDASGEERLWQDDAGRALLRCLQQWQEDATSIGMIEARYYPAIFEQFLASQSYYPFGEHPRLHLLSPLEARLLTADRMILCGMNEGSWPQALPPDPWMSKAMRHTVGLPPQEQVIGQAAHDLAEFLTVPEVFLTRALKEGGAPTTPCRWWQRMMLWDEAALQQGKNAEGTYLSGQWKQWLAQETLPTPALPPLPAPAPSPETTARPHRQGAVSISDVKRWFKDPYAFYAKRSLRVKPLEELDPDPSRAEWGELLHALFKEYSDHAAENEEAPLDLLMRLGTARLKAFEGIGLSYHIWLPKLEAICRQFLAWDAPRRASSAIVHEEELTLALEGMSLKGRADRIETAKGKALVLVDYKTGQAPHAKAVKTMREPQLPLEALMLLYRQKEELVSLRMEYWQMNGKEDSSPAFVGDGLELAGDAENILCEWIAAYDDPSMPYLASPGSTSADDAHEYALLERLKEWRF